jgi:hypothetical protein
LDSAGSVRDLLEDCSQPGDLLRSMKGRDCLDYLNDYQIIKKDYVPYCIESSGFDYLRHYSSILYLEVPGEVLSLLVSRIQATCTCIIHYFTIMPSLIITLIYEDDIMNTNYELKMYGERRQNYMQS